MKKASVILSSVLALGLLAGCGNNTDNAATPTNAPAETTAPATNAGNAGTETGQYADGTYYGTAAAADDGWQYFAVLTVEDGKITKANWDAFNVNKAGDTKKKLSEDGVYGMKAGGASSDRKSVV